MKLRDYREHTYQVCQKWLRNPTSKSYGMLVRCLSRWASCKKNQLADYGYNDTTEEMKWTVSYCSDRMNSGRAKAILRMLKSVSN